MTTYSSKPVEIPMSASAAYAKLTDLSSFQERLESLPEDLKSKVGDISFTADTISFNGTPMGALVLKLSETVPDKRVAFTAQGAPVPVIMSIALEDKDTDKAEAISSIDVEIPAMLKPMIGPKLKEAAEKMGEMIKNLVSLK
ncbi:MAG: hypothetical protein HDS41_07015 [Bacteroides sp.]|nr:hypothetical protein [Bacteroides sp.]